MDSSSGGEKDDSETPSLGGPSNLHDHSDLLIPNPSFSSPSPMMMNITSPSSVDHDLHNKQMDFQMTSPPQPMSCGDGASLQGQGGMDYGTSPSDEGQRPEGSPNVIVDDSPLQPCMDRNKESLKVKLQLRRPMNQLVEQGILPPPKTPAAFAGQRVRLERARMGDLLKAKIQQRPARQELIRQHILEDTDSRVAPSLAEKQRMLKRARLADSLNDYLIHRPGPLELVQKNILHAPDANIEKAIKEGHVCFKATSEGHVPGPSLPSKYTVNEDDSSSDISSPAGTPDASSSGHTTEANTPITKQSSDPSISFPSPSPIPSIPSNEVCSEVSLQPAKTNKSETVVPPPPPPPPPPHFILTTSAITTSPAQVQQITAPTAIFQVANPTTVIPPPPPLPTISHISQATPQTIVLSDGAVRDLLPQLQSAGFQLAAAHVQKPPSQSSSTLGKTRSSKKSSKSKSQPKARTIKFHEYKGPSNCQQKGGGSSSTSIASSSLSSHSNSESSYELLLKQQQLFLQWQLEWQHKYPQILLPAAPKVSGVSTSGSSISTSSSTKTLSSFPVTTIPASLCTNLINSNNQQSSQQPTITVATSTSSGNASPKIIPVALAPKVVVPEIAPKPPVSNIEDPKSVSSDVAVPSPASSTCSSSTTNTDRVSLRSLNLNNISEWKVNDLKAELKKRSLPVSGSKSQLVERLKTAAAKDTESEAKPIPTPPATVKMEVMSADENSSEALMDTDEKNKSSGNAQQASQPSPPTTAILIGAAPQNATVNSEGSNIISLTDLVSAKVNGVPLPISLQSILNLLSMSALTTNLNNNVDSSSNGLGNNNPTVGNNLKNATSTLEAVPTTTAKVISQLPISALVTTAAKAAAVSASNESSNILEQQKQILELQKEVSLSQQKLQQKDLKNVGPQEHRQVLRQHIQQKQKFQSQMQNLIQLQTQQAEQKKQQEQTQAQLVLIRSNPEAPASKSDQQITLSNSVLPVTIVSPQQQQQPQQPVSTVVTNHWLQQQDTTSKELSQSQEMNFDDLVRTMDSKDQKLESQTKSQMVDDVLEILIRNGELPPSAAQDPHSKNLLRNLGIGVQQEQVNNNGTVQPPPPPPPLPPPSFSVMLPTSIPFSRHQTTNNTDFLTFGIASGSNTEENLIKDAQEILRIREDLSNFGKSREAEAAAAAAAAQTQAGLKLDNISDNNNTSSSTGTSMDCGFFMRNGTLSSHPTNKDFDLSTTSHANSTTADSMDIGFNDTHSVSIHSSSPSNDKAQVGNHLQSHFNNSSPSPFDYFGQQGQGTNPSLKSHDTDHHHDHNNHHHHHFDGVDELLPVSLEMQMDTDYSDWLDTLLPYSTNTGSSSNNTSSSNIFDQHQHQQDSNNPGGKKLENNVLNHNNNNFSDNSSNHVNNSCASVALFNAIMDESNHVNHSSQRDPLLSSRSFATGLQTMSLGTMGTLPFREQLHQNGGFLFSAPQSHNNLNPTGMPYHHQSHGPPSVGSSSSGTALMDTDFDDMPTSSTCHNSKKSENNIILASSSNVIMPEMPSAQTNNITTPITTASINDNFLWDF